VSFEVSLSGLSFGLSRRLLASANGTALTPGQALVALLSGTPALGNLLRRGTFCVMGGSVAMSEIFIDAASTAGSAVVYNATSAPNSDSTAPSAAECTRATATLRLLGMRLGGSGLRYSRADTGARRLQATASATATAVASSGSATAVSLTYAVRLQAPAGASAATLATFYSRALNVTATVSEVVAAAATAPASTGSNGTAAGASGSAMLASLGPFFSFLAANTTLSAANISLVAPSAAVQVQPPASVLRSALTIAVAAVASAGSGDSGVAPLTIGLAAGIPGFVLLVALAAGIFIHRRRSRAGSSGIDTSSVASRPGRRGEHRTQNAFLDAASRAWAERSRMQQPGAAAPPAVANFRSPMWAGSQAQRQAVAAAANAGRTGSGGRAGAPLSKGRTPRPGPGMATSRSAVQPRGGAEEDIAFDSDASAAAGTGLKLAPPGLRLDLASMSRRRFQGPAAGAPAGAVAPGEGAQAVQRKVIPARTLSDRNLALLGIYSSGSAAGGVTARSAAGRGPAAVRRPQLRTRTRAAESGDGDDETSAAEAAPEPRRRKQRDVVDSGSEGDEGTGYVDGAAEGAPPAAGDAGQLPGEMRSPASFARGLVTASNARKVARSATRGRIVTDAPSAIGSNPAGAVPGGRRLRTARAPAAGASKPGGTVRRPGQQPHLTAPAASAAQPDAGDGAEEHVSVDVVVSGGAPRVRPSRGIPLRIDPDAEEGAPDEEATAEAHTAAAATPRVVDPELGPAGVLTFGAPSPAATDSELSLHRKATERKLAALRGPAPLPAAIDVVYGELAAGGRDNKLRGTHSRSPRAAAASAALTFDETPASARSPTAGTSPHMEAYSGIPAAADTTLRALAASLSPHSLRAGAGMRGPGPRGGFASASAPAAAAAFPPGVPNPVRGPLAHAFSSRNLSALLRKQRAAPSAAGTGLHGDQGGVYHGAAGEEAGAYDDFAASAHPDLNPMPHQSWHRAAPSYGSAASALSDPPLPEEPYADPAVAAAAFEAAEAAAAGFAGAVYRPLSAAHAGEYVFSDPDAEAAYGLRTVGSGHFDPPYDPSDADAYAGSAYDGPQDRVSGRVLRAVSGVGARAYSSAPLGAGTGALQPAPPAGRASSRVGGGEPGEVSRRGASASRKRPVGTPSQRQVAGTLSPSASSVTMRGVGSPYGAY